MDTFTAIPRFQRLPIRVLNLEKYDEWLNSDPALNLEMPFITKIFIVYEKGIGCPVPVQIEVDQLDVDYRAAIPTDEERETLSSVEYITKWRRANTLLRRNLMLAVVKGMDMESANILASEDDNGNSEARRIAELTGWMTPRELDNDNDEEAKSDNEGEAVTGESTLLISPQSIQE